MRTCVYPGSFDPVTNGHIDIIERAAKQFDKVVVAVLVNSSKKSSFSLEERVELLKKALAGKTNVEVESFSGLLIDFMKEKDIKIIIKGLRALSDFEYEFQMALLNKSLNPEIETFFIASDSNNTFLSSSVVRELARLGGRIDELVPAQIKDDIIDKYSKDTRG